MTYDLSNLFINFTKCPVDQKLSDFFPELAPFKEFSEVKDDNYIRIAICTADLESPFVKMRDRESMLVALFNFLKIPIKKEEEKKFFKEVMEYKNVEVMNCFARYLQVYHDIDWTEYQTTKQTHDILTMESNKPKSDDEDIDKFVARKVKLQNQLKMIGKDLKLIESKIFPDSKAAREVAINEKKLISTYAERYAQENTFL